MEFEYFTISKLDAARRQLDMAIELWFADKDQVSIHTLAHAAHQVIHDVNEKKGKPGGLFYNSAHFKPEHHSMLNKRFRETGNFFKHADKDHEAVYEFSPGEAEGHIVYATIGLTLLGEAPSVLAQTFAFWFCVHEPDMMFDAYREAFEKTIDAEHLRYLKGLSKPEFLQYFMRVRAEAKLSGIP